LAPGQTLLDDSLFWQHQSDGLAAFLAADMSRHFCLPHSFSELLVVNSRFHITPLLPLLTGSGRFYVLALSQNDVRLLQGTRFTVAEVDLKQVPRTLADALQFDDPERQLQWHTRAAERGGERAAMFHGHGVGVDDQKDRILRYFRRIDAGLQEFLRNERAPLILAGVEYYFPIYREANTYAHLMEGGIRGNPELERPDELHARAWELVGPVFEQDQENALQRYQQLAGTGRTTDDLALLLPAARDGRVDTLLLSRDVHQWGSFDAESGDVHLRDEPSAGNDDLLDLAATYTLTNSGTVYVLDADKMPGGNPTVAVFRY
jgi:hypothetical protein